MGSFDMATDGFEECLNFTLHYEGLYSCIRSDPGNWTGSRVGDGKLKGTKYGISAASYPDLDIANLSRERAAEIYHRDYWLKLESSCLLPCEAMVVFDALVNNGPARAKKWQTEARGSDTDPIVFIKIFSEKRLVFDRSLHRLWRKFGKGWQARILACEAKAIGMASGRVGLQQAAASARLKVLDARKNVARTGAIGGVGVAAQNAAHGNVFLSVVLIGGIVASMALLVWRASIQSARQKALESEAKTIAPTPTAVIQTPRQAASINSE
jgi:lysozyme family protein